jgi:HlyD family secretion protein
VKKFVIIVIIAVIILLVGFGAIAGFAVKKLSGSKKMGPAVRLENPKRSELTETVSAPGEIEPILRVGISAKVAARIVELPFAEGSKVTKGDPAADPPVPPSVLVRLDATDAEARLRSAEAYRDAQAAQIEGEKYRIECQRLDIEAAKATLRQAELDLDRIRQLRESKDMSQSDLDQAQTQYDELKARCGSAESGLKAAEAGLSVQGHRLEASEADVVSARDAITYTTITSPIDGVVTRCNAKVGELVMTGTMNNPGTMILEVADLSRMEAVLRLDEVDIASVEPGQTATVNIHAWPDEPFEGTVQSVALTQDRDNRGTKYFKTHVLITKCDKPLQAGLTADAEIGTKTHAGVLTLPSQAIMGQKTEELPLNLRENNPLVDMTKTTTPVVYCFKEGKSVMRPVKIGPSDKTRTVILEGVSEEDRVIVGPYKALAELKDDQTVRDEAEVEKEKAEKEARNKKDQKKGGDTDAKQPESK